MSRGWRTYKNELVWGSLALMFIFNIIMVTVWLLFDLPLDLVSDAFMRVLGVMFAMDALFLLLMGFIVMATDDIVFRRFDLGRDEFVAAILPVLEWNNVSHEEFTRLVATPVEHRMKKGSVLHYSLNGGEEDMYIGTVRMRLEVALGPYEDDHVKVIDRLVREIDVTVDNL